MGSTSFNRHAMTRWLLPTLAATALVLASCGSATTPPTATTTTPTSTSTSPSTSVTTATTASPTTSTPSPTTSTASPTKTTASPTSPAPVGGEPTHAEAIGAWMAKKGYAYAGSCEDTTLEDDIGKYCSSLCENRGNQAIYKIGPTFSEYTTWLLLEKSGGLWRVVATAKDTGTAPAPW